MGEYGSVLCSRGGLSHSIAPSRALFCPSHSLCHPNERCLASSSWACHCGRWERHGGLGCATRACCGSPISLRYGRTAQYSRRSHPCSPHLAASHTCSVIGSLCGFDDGDANGCVGVHSSGCNPCHDDHVDQEGPGCQWSPVAEGPCRGQIR